MACAIASDHNSQLEVIDEMEGSRAGIPSITRALFILGKLNIGTWKVHSDIGLNWISQIVAYLKLNLNKLNLIKLNLNGSIMN